MRSGGKGDAIPLIQFFKMPRPVGGVIHAFDPRRSAILLIGGKKTGGKRWYEQHIPLAERIYEEHLKSLEDEHGGAL